MEPVRIATWNVSWATSGSKRFEDVQRRIAELDSDILVLTETTHDLIPSGGYFAKGGPGLGLRRQALPSKIRSVEMAFDRHLERDP